MTMLPKGKFPKASELLLEPDAKLEKLEGEGYVSPRELMKKMAENYGLCHANSDKHEALIKWVREQYKVR